METDSLVNKYFPELTNEPSKPKSVDKSKSQPQSVIAGLAF
jgi:hypothetical protein